MKSFAQRTMHWSPRGPVACVRLLLNWLLVAVLALDLASSPLHAHLHDGALPSAGTTWASAGHQDDAARVHVVQDGAAFSHSIMALRGHGTEVRDAPTDAAVHSATPWSVAEIAAKAAALPLPWPPDRHRAGSSAFRSLPPDGRAPPRHG